MAVTDNASVRARRSIAFFVLSTGLTALFTAAAQPSASAPTMEFGVSTNYRWSSTIATDTVDLTVLDGTGITSVREDVLWDVVEPAQDKFDWRRYDALIEANARHGLTVLPLFTGTVAWANTSGRRDLPPDDLADYVDLVHAYLARYGPNGAFWSDHAGPRAQPADAIEIWNEPWYPRFWGPQGADPAAYASMVRAVAAMVDDQFPTVRLVANGDWKWDHAVGAFWLDALLDADPGLVEVVDAFAAHPYPWPFTTPAANCLQSTSQLASIRDRLGETSRPGLALWVTELGVRTTAPDAADAYSGGGAADYLRCVLAAPQLTTWLGDASRFYTFVFRRAAMTENAEDAGYDLLTADGQPSDVLATYIGLVHAATPIAPTARPYTSTDRR